MLGCGLGEAALWELGVCLVVVCKLVKDLSCWVTNQMHVKESICLAASRRV